MLVQLLERLLMERLNSLGELPSIVLRPNMLRIVSNH